MNKLFFTLASLLMIFLFFACEKESVEEVPGFIEGKFVYSTGNIYIRDLDWTNPKQLTSDAKYVKPPSGISYYETYYEKPMWSHDGTQIMCIKKLSNLGYPSIWVMDKNGENSVKVLQLNEYGHAIDWSHDGKWIVYSTYSDNNIHIVSLDGQERKVLNIDDESEIRYIDWSYDSKKLAAISNSGALFVLDVTTEEIHKLTNDTGTRENPCWSPDGQFIAFTYSFSGYTRIKKIKLFNVKDNIKEMIREDDDFLLDVYGWTPDGDYLIYFESTDWTLKAIQISTGLTIDLQYTYNSSDGFPGGDLFIFP